ncbi:hypothetical protein B0I72DRAFT_138532 [Yarrowia lipolytica]|uniref:YALI0D12969p n=2 Tax=Yarrowia lipolytica TaxID=4952 RepID=Q6C993_YARLI|nr:YALI0D12969p [Yarrowia lipolytica CLIB122]AOW03996.1 hypothetical protein YALI1_D16118g [Yarrowia lipolytica]KAB8285178.1 hypothetical protein BKA91DRAFT_133944 [Yarrowia lipolytica]KAE8171224.1 hypothetical protein BKA90DRAFT_139384 [Yarrowia lipolytica]KAJ8054442.1 hypothetical protein LXG23DRAFT_56000 [Yarrowia lipolytica]QNP98413.1 Arrestin domain-containing protein [Yarrowia lipolytica]|eukprot:XP_502769.1 YALI0D12969p [Yarrowia lipolytica CLIB122]
MAILSRNSTTQLPLFDIRLRTNDRNVVVVKGSPDVAPSVQIAGAIVLATVEPISIKRIQLKLYATLRLDWSENITTPRGPQVRNHKYEKQLYEKTWDDIWAPFQASSNTLRQGNHEVPFDCILPGEIPESIEGLEGGMVVWKLAATIERGRFSNNIAKKQHLRVVRTLGHDNVELTQTMSINNVWPNKVDYEFSLPSKAVAVGSSTPVHLSMTPLLKGLKLGSIKMTLVEISVLTTPFGHNKQVEKVVANKTIEATADGYEGHDLWEVDDFFPIPPSLSKVTQDAEVPNLIKVTHKFKFVVGLKNPGGHTSELRASLPIHIFISPNVAVSSHNPDPETNGGASQTEEDTLFSNTGGSSNNENLLLEDAPPTYSDHIYDRLWSEISISALNTPMASGANTPIVSRRNSLDMDALAPNLAAMSMDNLFHRAHPPVSHNGSSVPSVPGSPSPASGGQDYFSIPHETSVPSTPGVVMRGFDSGSGLPSQHNSTTDLESLSRVPSYGTALKSPARQTIEESPYYPSSDANRGVRQTLSPGAGATASSGSSPRLPSSPSFSGKVTPNGSKNHSRNGSAMQTPFSQSISSFLTRNHSSRSLLEEASKKLKKPA